MSHSKDKVYKALSKPLLINVEHFFENVQLLSSHLKITNSSILIGWGMKHSGIKALQLAKKYKLKFLLLEDGFIRSLGLGVESCMGHSLVTDSSGSIYYDSSQPSDLEQLITKISLSGNELKRSKLLLDVIKSYRLSKYNNSPDIKITKKENNYVLVVDQTFGDSSISYGGADANSFLRMLETAIQENPNSIVLVKIHPDVISGKKKGHLLNAAKDNNCIVISNNVNPWSFFDAVSKVYVVTSQLGFEALMANKEVVCFGLPFYAGWGLTKDTLECPRRNTSKTLEEVFYAAYLQYSIYSNPYTRQQYEIEDTIAIISDQKYHFEKFSGEWLALDFSSWKKAFLANYFGSNSKLEFASEKKIEKVISIKPKVTKIVVWSSKLTKFIEKFCDDKGIELWRMEDGFIRSVGLGVDLAPPMSLVLDSKGIYYDPNSSSDLEDILNNAESFDKFLLKRAKNVRLNLIRLNVSKYNVDKKVELDLPKNKKIILVPGQVEDDASIQKGTYKINNNYKLLCTVKKNNPEAFIIYKPHPDVLSGGRLGKIKNSLDELVDLELLHGDISALLDSVDEVHTMTSLTGFEALLRNIKVVIYGMPFYGGWGLTEDNTCCDRRKRKLTLDELVAGALIRYPIYVEPYTNQVCNVETIIEIISKMKMGSVIHKPSLKTKLYRKMKSLKQIYGKY